MNARWWADITLHNHGGEKCSTRVADLLMIKKINAFRLQERSGSTMVQQLRLAPNQEKETNGSSPLYIGIRLDSGRTKTTTVLTTTMLDNPLGERSFHTSSLFGQV